jgi:hypothetical protein
MEDSAPVRQLYFVWAYSGLGEIDRAMHHLQRAADIADPHALYLDAFVMFDSLREHPRFQQLRRQQGLSL